MNETLDKLEGAIVEFIEKCPYAEKVVSVDRLDFYTLKVVWESCAATHHVFVYCVGELLKLEREHKDPSKAARAFYRDIASKMNVSDAMKLVLTRKVAKHTNRFRQRVAACRRCGKLYGDDSADQGCVAPDCGGRVVLVVVNQPKMPYPGAGSFVETYTPSIDLGIIPGKPLSGPNLDDGPVKEK